MQAQGESCPECGRIFSVDTIEYLEFNNWICPDCKHPVKMLPVSDLIKGEIERIDRNKLLEAKEYGTLYEINKSDKPLRAKEIAQELDCSYQLVGKVAKKLDEEKGLLKRENGLYSLTSKAKNNYFERSQY
jgi:hypothetical protein